MDLGWLRQLFGSCRTTTTRRRVNLADGSELARQIPTVAVLRKSSRWMRRIGFAGSMLDWTIRLLPPKNDDTKQCQTPKRALRAKISLPLRSKFAYLQ